MRCSGLELDRPAEEFEVAFDSGEGELEGAATVGTGGALGEDALALELEGLDAALAVGFGAAGFGGELGRGGGDGRCGGFRLLLFDALRLPAFGHAIILRLQVYWWPKR